MNLHTCDLSPQGIFKEKKRRNCPTSLFPASRTFAYKNIQEDVLYTEPTQYKLIPSVTNFANG